MPKRKRDFEVPDDTGEAVHGAAQQRVQHKLQQGTVKLGHAFKIAKGFERQKLGRRRKNAVAQKDEKDVQRIDAEIAALKTLDGTKCAQSYLYKTLSKIKAVTESPKLSVDLSKPAKTATDTAALNVNARLCNSNPVKEALPAVLVEVQRALGIEVSREEASKKRRLRAKDYREELTPKVAPTRMAGDEGLTRVGAQETESSEELDDDDHGEGARLDDGDSDAELDAFSDRLASSEDSDQEGMDVETLERQLEREGIQRASKASSKAYNHAADLSLSDSGPPSASPCPEPQKAPAPKPKKSSFIPSLTMGGYISGSGSDLDDDEVDVAPKKNRRGQRARQQLWEKKFGAKAKHLQKQERSQGWDPKRGATDGGGPRGKGKPVDRNASGPAHRGNNSHAGGKDLSKRANGPSAKHRDDSGPIHPSWEAAKKAKEKKDAPVYFQGKKITFD